MVYCTNTFTDWPRGTYLLCLTMFLEAPVSYVKVRCKVGLNNSSYNIGINCNIDGRTINFQTTACYTAKPYVNYREIQLHITPS